MKISEVMQTIMETVMDEFTRLQAERDEAWLGLLQRNTMKNKPKAVFVKNITDLDGEIGELYTVGSDFYVVKWYRGDVERKPCKHNTIFTEVWQSDKRGKVGCGRDPIHEWQRWHSGKSIMAHFLKSRACPSTVEILACPSTVEILAQNRDDLLERMSESGNAYNSDYPYGLMLEAEEEIKLLRKERDAAVAVVNEFVSDTTSKNQTPDHECEFKHNPETGKCDACTAWGNYVGLFRS